MRRSALSRFNAFRTSLLGCRPCDAEYALDHALLVQSPCVSPALRVVARPVVGSPVTPIMLSVVTRPFHGSPATLNSAQRRRSTSCWQNSNAEKLPNVGNLPVLGFTATLSPTTVVAEPSNGTATTVNHLRPHESCSMGQTQESCSINRHRMPRSAQRQQPFAADTSLHAGISQITAARFPDGAMATMSDTNESCITKPPVFSGLSASINGHVRLGRLGSEYQRFL